MENDALPENPTFFHTQSTKINFNLLSLVSLLNSTFSKLGYHTKPENPFVTIKEISHFSDSKCLWKNQLTIVFVLVGWESNSVKAL